jgi:hypothetical protein
MTDTANPYYVNANQAIYFRAPNSINTPYWSLNPIITFRHKFQTSLTDGCIVEFSTDTGQTWKNVGGDCNSAVNPDFQGINTHNCYGTTDTLPGGERAFFGTSNGWQISRFQFF